MIYNSTNQTIRLSSDSTRMRRAISEYQNANRSVHFTKKKSSYKYWHSPWTHGLIHPPSFTLHVLRKNEELNRFLQREIELWSVKMECRSYCTGAAVAVFVLAFSLVMLESTVSATSRRTEIIATDGDLLRRNLLANGLGVTPPMGWVLRSNTNLNGFPFVYAVPLFLLFLFNQLDLSLELFIIIQ